MDRRASKRLTNKVKRNVDVDGDGSPEGNRHNTVGGTLGVTPKRGAKGNLHLAMAADVAAAAAARLDAFSVEEQCGITRRKKSRKSKKQRRRSSYVTSSRESMDLLGKTAQYVGSDEDPDEDEEKAGDGEEAAMPVLMSDVEEKEEGPVTDGTSVIVTPGPRPTPNSDDEKFIKSDAEGVSPPGSTHDDDDEDYV